MTPALMVTLEFAITAGAAVVWAGWEYWKIRPGKADEPPPKRAAPDADSPEDPRHPER